MTAKPYCMKLLSQFIEHGLIRGPDLLPINIEQRLGLPEHLSILSSMGNGMELAAMGRSSIQLLLLVGVDDTVSLGVGDAGEEVPLANLGFIQERALGLVHLTG
jgi:hypothetical protein